MTIALLLLVALLAFSNGANDNSKGVATLVGYGAARPFQAHDLLTDAHYLWQGPRNYVLIDPHSVPAQIFRLRRRVRTEQDFDYFL